MSLSKLKISLYLFTIGASLVCAHSLQAMRWTSVLRNSFSKVSLKSKLPKIKSVSSKRLLALASITSLSMWYLMKNKKTAQAEPLMDLPKTIEKHNARQEKKFQQSLLSKEDHNSSQEINPIFKIYYPEKLSEEEKKISAMSRFSQLYMGEIPLEIESVIAHLDNFKDDSIKHQIPNTLLLHGSPGTGKSYLIQALSHALQVPYISCNAGSFIDKYAGESAKNIVKFFKIAKDTKEPLLVFIDEVDAIANKREDGTIGEYRSALNVLLTEIQDLTFKKNVYIFVATNTPKTLDPAIKSRFIGQVITIEGIKSKEEFEAFFKKSLKNNKIDEKLYNIDELAEYLTKKARGYGYSPYSLRESSKIIPLALTFEYAIRQREGKSSKPASDLKPFIEKAITSIENSKK